ncbi:hypothetical protein [Reinekea marinisedimentorum]|uniref:hypothetical protein n=1 Tax=Reinekea marinisedimentorum TaxID=230495 RepID=UPI00104E485F|nr:hypothetical protein [Reinekea marinisedimentorum]
MLPVVIFLCALSANAEMIGGHERQRLVLHLTELLHRHYEFNLLQLYLPELPVEVVTDSPDQRTLYALLTTLAEENIVVEQKKSAKQVIDSGRHLIAAVSEFSAPNNSSVERVAYGRVVIDSVDSMQTLKQEGSAETRVEIQFLWHLVSPAEWLWAPRLNSIPEIRYLRESTAASMKGSAIFIWQEQKAQWLLEASPNIRLQ